MEYRDGLKEPRRGRPYCAACERAVRREFYRRMTPKQRKRKREVVREANAFYRERKRREEGREPAWKRHAAKVDRTERVFLPREPLLAEMDRYVREQRGNGRPDFSWGDMAMQAGVAERQLHRLRVGESRRVRIDVADRIAIAVGVPLSLIYPDSR
jgi:hypothetical protein